MLSKILVSPEIDLKVKEINNILASHIPGGSPNDLDVLYIKTGEKLGISQVRTVTQHLSTKPYKARGKMVILEDASALSLDAQNALLKTLEEPPEEAILILAVNSENDLLPTILSRCELVYITTPKVTSEADYVQDLEKLISSSVEDRFTYIEKLKEKEEFLHSLIQYWHKNLLKNPTKETKNFTQELLSAEKWSKSNVNIRAILEYLMQVMPN